jgi:hypothetical protein
MTDPTVMDLIQVASKLGSAKVEIGGKAITAYVTEKGRTLFLIDGERASRDDVNDWRRTARLTRRLKTGESKMTKRKVKRTKKLEVDMTDGFEGALDRLAVLDPIPFYVKREMAETAMQAALSYLEFYQQKTGEKK